MIRKFAGCILSIIIAGFVMNSCKTSGHSEKFYERQEKKNVAVEQKEYDNRVKAHRDQQTKQTQKMLKKREKESKKLNKSKKPKLKSC